MDKKPFKGSSFLEFMMVAPVFLLLVMGMIESSALMYDKVIITDASREGARYGVVIRSGGYAALEDVQAYAQSYCSNKLINFSGSPSVSVTAMSSNEEGEEPAFGDSLTVTVTFQYTGVGFMDMLGQTYNLSATTVMSYE